MRVVDFDKPWFPSLMFNAPTFCMDWRAQKIANLRSSPPKRAQKPHIIMFWLHNHKSLCISLTVAFPLSRRWCWWWSCCWCCFGQSWCQSWCWCWLCLNTPYKRPLCYWCLISSPLNPIFWEKKRVLRSLLIHFKKLPLYIFHLSMFLVNHIRD